MAEKPAPQKLQSTIAVVPTPAPQTQQAAAPAASGSPLASFLPFGRKAAEEEASAAAAAPAAQTTAVPAEVAAEPVATGSTPAATIDPAQAAAPEKSGLGLRSRLRNIFGN